MVTIKLERGFNGFNQTLNVEQELDKKSTELRLIYNSLREIVTNWFAWGAKSIFYAAKHALVKHPAQASHTEREREECSPLLFSPQLYQSEAIKMKFGTSQLGVQR